MLGSTSRDLILLDVELEHIRLETSLLPLAKLRPQEWKIPTRMDSLPRIFGAVVIRERLAAEKEKVRCLVV